MFIILFANYHDPFSTPNNLIKAHLENLFLSWIDTLYFWKTSSQTLFICEDGNRYFSGKLVIATVDAYEKSCATSTFDKIKMKQI